MGSFDYFIVGLASYLWVGFYKLMIDCSGDPLYRPGYAQYANLKLNFFFVAVALSWPLHMLVQVWQNWQIKNNISERCSRRSLKYGLIIIYIPIVALFVWMFVNSFIQDHFVQFFVLLFLMVFPLHFIHRIVQILLKTKAERLYDENNRIIDPRNWNK